MNKQQDFVDWLAGWRDDWPFFKDRVKVPLPRDKNGQVIGRNYQYKTETYEKTNNRTA